MGLFTTYKGLEAQGNVALKSLKFNNDDSFNAQPFIQTPIPGDDGIVSIVNNKNTGFVNTVNEAAAGFLNLNDKLKISPTVSTLATGIYRSAVDVVRLSKFMTTPSGLEFIAKQELLSLMAPRLETSGILNGGIYNPVTTLAQAGVNIAGIHIPSYQNNTTKFKFGKKGDQEKYPFIPGIGPNKGKKAEFDIVPTYGELVYKRGLLNPNTIAGNRIVNLYSRHVGTQYSQGSGTHNSIYRYIGGPGSIMGVGYTSIDFSTDPAGNPVRTMGVNFIFPEGQFNTPETYQAVYTAPDRTVYEDVNRLTSLEITYGLGDPGSARRWDMEQMKFTTSSYTSSMDKVNSQVIYSSNVTGTDEENIKNSTQDLIMFKVGVIDINTYETNYMHFRSFIDSFSDSYSSDWSSQTYMGRGEKLYKYNSFDRSISVSFTVAAQSRGEMSSIYQKLNYLASTVTPQYTDKGYMTGNIAKLTVGGYLKDQHGKIDSISYEIPEESPWLIASRMYERYSAHDKSTEINELPFIIKVQMRFTPIHNFRPELVTNVLGNKFGDQRYITKKYEQPEAKNTQDDKKDTGGKFIKGGKVTDYEGGGTKATRGPAKPTVGSPAKLFTDTATAKQARPAGLTDEYLDHDWSIPRDDIKMKASDLKYKIQQKITQPIGDGIGNAYHYVKDKLTKDSKPPIAG